MGSGSRLAAPRGTSGLRSDLFFMTFGLANLSLVVYRVQVPMTPDPSLKPFLGDLYRLVDETTLAASQLAGVFRSLGFFTLVLSLFGLQSLWRSWVGRQPWVLWVVMASAVLAYLGSIGFHKPIGNIGPFEITEQALFLPILVSGLIVLGDRGRLDAFLTPTHRRGSRSELQTEGRLEGLPGKGVTYDTLRFTCRNSHHLSGPWGTKSTLLAHPGLALEPARGTGDRLRQAG